jgi:hypothetical protein
MLDKEQIELILIILLTFIPTILVGIGLLVNIIKEVKNK